MAEKKRRTELDIDDDLLAPREEAAPAPEQPDATPEPTPKTEETTAPSKGGRKKLMIIGGLALGGMIITAVAVWGTLTYLSEPEPAPEPVVAMTPEPTPEPTALPQRDVKPIAPTYSFEPFIIPVRAGADIRFVSLSLAVEMTGPEVEKEIERNLVLVRENILSVLERARLEDLNGGEPRRQLLINVAIAVNRSIQSGAVMNTMVTGLITR